MRKDEKASVSMIKIICISLALILCSGICVKAANTRINNVKIVFANNYELNVLTTKTKVKDILEDNHIVLSKDETVSPKLEDEISEEKQICIANKATQETYVGYEGTNEEIDMEAIKQTYDIVTEKFETLEIEIPYETITKDVSEDESQEAITKVIQEGVNGLKVITYKVTYKDEIEIDRVEVESNIIKEPIDKIVQISKKSTSRSGVNRVSAETAQTSATISLAQKVENITPKTVTLNASAYTASTCGKSSSDKSYGYTASGAKAQAWYTVAAGKKYAMGTIMYIPYFKDMPNGGWFVVQDRGSAISNGKVDVYMSTYGECKNFGRRNLECYIYEF